MGHHAFGTFICRHTKQLFKLLALLNSRQNTIVNLVLGKICFLQINQEAHDTRSFATYANCYTISYQMLDILSIADTLLHLSH